MSYFRNIKENNLNPVITVYTLVYVYLTVSLLSESTEVKVRSVKYGVMCSETFQT